MVKSTKIEKEAVRTKRVSGKTVAKKKVATKPVVKKAVSQKPKKVNSGKLAKTEAKTNNVIHDDMVGKKFSGVTVLEPAGSTIEGRAIYRCGCDCGSVFLTSGTNLRTGRIKSCGCQAGHVKRAHYIGKSAVIGALEILNQVCTDYHCTQSCPLWETCHTKNKGSVKVFTSNALKEIEKRAD